VPDNISSVLPVVRKRAGFDFHCHFTTNSSKLIKNVLKQEVEWKENKLPILINDLKAVVDRHAKELEKARIGIGEWSFVDSFTHLKVSNELWFSMSQQEKELHMKKVLNCRDVQ
jgi:hypothetical protein